MAYSDFNPQEYKDRQRRDWNAVSTGWESWWDTLETGAQHISQKMLQMAGAASGHRILDIATGIGEPALSAARLVGPRGRVIATDQAAGMLDIARQRAAREGLNNIEFVPADAENLLGVEPEFDVVLCRWGLMFLPDVGSALSRIHQILAPGGRLAAAVWSTPERVPSISLAMRTVTDYVQAPPAPPNTPNPFVLADRDNLYQLFERTGFRDLSIESVTVTFTMPSAEAYTDFTQDIAAPVVAIVNDQPLEHQEKIWAAVTEAARQFEIDDGTVRFENETL